MSISKEVLEKSKITKEEKIENTKTMILNKIKSNFVDDLIDINMDCYNKHEAKEQNQELMDYLDDIKDNIEYIISIMEAKEVYIIMSPEGGIGLDISTSKGKCYIDLEEAEIALKSKNEWSKSKGYGTYALVPLEVK